MGGAVTGGSFAVAESDGKTHVFQLLRNGGSGTGDQHVQPARFPQQLALLLSSWRCSGVRSKHSEACFEHRRTAGEAPTCPRSA